MATLDQTIKAAVKAAMANPQSSQLLLQMMYDYINGISPDFPPGPGYESVNLTVTVKAGEAITKDEVLYISIIDGKAYKAIANDPYKKEVVGFADEDAVTNADIRIVIGGVLRELSSLYIGDYYLSSTDAGQITRNPPSTSGTYVVTVGTATSATELVMNTNPATQININPIIPFDINNNVTTPTSLMSMISPFGHSSCVCRITTYRKTSTTTLSDSRDITFVLNPSTQVVSQSETFTGDDTGISFSLNSDGELLYTSTNMSGSDYVGKMRLEIISTGLYWS